MRALGFLWKEERTPEKGPGMASAGCQAFSSSAVLLGPLLVLTPGQRGAFRGWAAWPGAMPCPVPGLGLRLLPGLRPPAVGSEAVLSGVGLQLDSLDSSSSEEERGSDFLLAAAPPLLPPPAPLALAARSCLRNLARRFWNQTCKGGRAGEGESREAKSRGGQELRAAGTGWRGLRLLLQLRPAPDARWACSERWPMQMVRGAGMKEGGGCTSRMPFPPTPLLQQLDVTQLQIQRFPVVLFISDWRHSRAGSEGHSRSSALLEDRQDQSCLNPPRQGCV